MFKGWDSLAPLSRRFTDKAQAEIDNMIADPDHPVSKAQAWRDARQFADICEPDTLDAAEELAAIDRPPPAEHRQRKEEEQAMEDYAARLKRGQRSE